MFNGPKILGNSSEGLSINLARKIPIFFVTKHYLFEDAFTFESVAFDNLSYDVFYFVDLFFQA